MKKIVCVLITVLLCIPMFTAMIVPAVASGNLSDNLVAHYDFEGGDLTTQLSDKATATAYKDNLTVNNRGNYDESQAPVIVDGTYTKYGTTSANKTNQALITDSTNFLESDMVAVAGEHTWVLRFKLGDMSQGDTANKYRVLIDCRNSASGDNLNKAFYFAHDLTNNCFEVKISNTTDGNAGTGIKMNFPNTAYIDNDPSKGVNYDLWWNLIITVDQQGEDWVVSYYYAFDDAVASGYTLGGSGVGATGDRREAKAGNNPRFLTECRDRYATLDDVKFYNVAFTEADIETATGANVNKIPKLKYYQTAGTSGNQTIRFISTFDDVEADLSHYDAIGYYITEKEGDTVKVDNVRISVNKVYQSLLGTNLGVSATYTAAAAGAKYFMALSVKGIPNNATVILTPYVVVNGVELLGGAVEFAIAEDGTVTATPVISTEVPTSVS